VITNDLFRRHVGRASLGLCNHFSNFFVSQIIGPGGLQWIGVETDA